MMRSEFRQVVGIFFAWRMVRWNVVDGKLKLGGGEMASLRLFCVALTARISFTYQLALG